MSRHLHRLDVVVPTLEEEKALPRLLGSLGHLEPAGVDVRIVVADGGSRDGTVAIARDVGATVVRAPQGRASQLRAGVEATSAPWLLLLHADCRLTPDAARALGRWLDSATPRESAYFAFSLDGQGWFWRFIEWGQRWRERVSGLVYGDQGLLLSRETWDAVGGVPRMALMEDVELVDRVRAHGSLTRLSAALPTSPRRYEEEGRVRGWLRNTLLISLHRLGVPPARLARMYPGRQRRGHVARATVVVFARAPRPGEVKTRLAADVGEAAATRLYRAMGRRVVDALRDGPWRTVVAGTPADALDEIRAWLGAGPDYVAQRGADLGARMHAALSDALVRSERACVVGTDAPDLDAATVASALAGLDDHDVVLGPAEDGGYYLLALSAPRGELFRDVPWSTGGVLEITLARAAAADLRVCLLEELRDVDTLEDVPDDLLVLVDPSGAR